MLQATNEDLQFKAALEESMKVTQKLAFFVFEILPVKCMFTNTLQLEISAELDSSLKTPVKGIKRQSISLDEDEAPSKRSRESDVR